MNNKSSILLAGTFSFPQGEAASSRILNLARGFKDITDNVRIISMYHHEDSMPFSPAGNYLYCGQDINFKALIPFKFTGDSIIDRFRYRSSFFAQCNNLVKEIISSLEGSESELLFLYGRSYYFLKHLISEIRKRDWKTKLVFDVVEPPRNSTSMIEYLLHPITIDSTLVFKRLLNEFDLCTFISFNLLEAFGKRARKHQILPSVIYYQKNSPIIATENDVLKIGYLGALINKDYPELLYNLCNELYIKGIPFELDIIGRFRLFDEGIKWEKIISNSIFSKSIRFHSNISNQNRDELLNKLDFLVLFRKPELLQAYTFPTRVVELLSYQKVIIVNDYGDFAKYFKTLQNAVVVLTDSINETICDLVKLKSKTLKLKIIHSAAQLLEKDFNAQYQAKVLIKKVLND